MTRTRESFALAALTSCLLAGPPAFADSAADKAAADALFDQAKHSMAAGNYADACPKLEESERLDPTLGTQLNLADCYEHVGRTASAWGLFNAVARAAEKRGDKDRAAEAERRAGLLAPNLQKLAIVVPPATRVSGLEVRKDGELVGAGSWGSALPTDPGAHTIEASAPGHKPWSTVVRVETNGSAASVEIPTLDVQEAPAPAPPAPFWSTQRIVGTSVGAAGVAGLIVGAVAGGITLSKASASRSHCAANLSTCDPTGAQLQADARVTAHVSDAAFAIGGAALIGGGIALFTSPRARDGTAPATPASGTPIQVGPIATGTMIGVLVAGGW